MHVRFLGIDKAIEKFGEAGCSDNILSALRTPSPLRTNDMRWPVNVLGGVGKARQGVVSSHELNRESNADWSVIARFGIRHLTKSENESYSVTTWQVKG